MKSKYSLFIQFVCLFFNTLLISTGLSGQNLTGITGNELLIYQDSQVLYNGKIWRREYSNVMGNEFLFSALWLKGNVVINDIVYRDRMFRYDIADDELLIRRPDRVVLIMNREMIRRFDLTFEDITYRFENFTDSNNFDLDGYARVLYDGKCRLLVKYVKEISPLGYQKVYDIFIQTEQLYLVKEGRIFRLRSRRGLLDILDDKRDELRKFMRINNIVLMPRQPESVIPVLVYYNSLFDQTSDR